uniref:Uncharacterized protein n=1 Tax=Rhizophora mucronata TaxID=61149 RepID=A0A2P2N4I6_RHIMU
MLSNFIKGILYKTHQLLGLMIKVPQQVGHLKTHVCQ